MSKTIELSEKFLSQSAGWQVMKEARKIHDQGKVLQAEWKAPELRGQVQVGDKRYACGLSIHSSFDLENHCSCRESRQWGQLCVHSVAAGLEALHPRMQQTQTEEESAGPWNLAGPPEIGGSIGKGADTAIRLQRCEDQEAAALLELQVVFPGTLEMGLAQGKLQIFVEASVDGGPFQPLDRVDRESGYQMSMADDRLLSFIEEWVGEPASMIRIDSERLPGLINASIGHPGLSIAKKRKLTISNVPYDLPLSASLLKEGGIEVKLLDGFTPPLLVQGERGFWGYKEDRLTPLGLTPRTVATLQGPVRLSRKDVPQFLIEDWPELTRLSHFESNFKLDDFTLKTSQTRFKLDLVGGLARLKGRLSFEYDGDVLDEGGEWMPDKKDVHTYYTRNIVAETSAIGLLSSAGFRINNHTGEVALEGQDKVLPFFASVYPRIKKEWKITLEERLEQSVDKKIEWIQPRFESSPSGEQWLDLEVRYQSTSGTTFSPSEIKQFLLSGRKHRPLSNGKFLVMDTDAVEEFNAVLQDCHPEQTGGRYRLSSLQEDFLKSTVEEIPGWNWNVRKGPLPGQSTGRTLPERPDPGPLVSVLRDYQSIGLNWLWQLRRRSASGILADDMGLGKTLQTLALLKASLPYRSGPWLVICPSSLVFNWIAETEKFLPELRVAAYTGDRRKDVLNSSQVPDLIVTSYGIARLDLDILRNMEFDTVVLDEAQHIKNRKTQNAKAVKSLKSRYRLVLSGTPMENSVLDLWSIYDFLMPGYLGRAEDFKERYEIPISKHMDKTVMERLGRRLKPFMLRRKKSEVAKELPARVDHVAWCEMTPKQRALYTQILETTRSEVFGSMKSGDEKRNRMMVLTAILRLRQVCCDPSLLPLPDPESIAGSGKLEVFEEILQEALNGGHRVLVFSQFTSMLNTLGSWLENQSLAYVRLDGQTRNRAEVVGRFQNTPDIPVFLISLKAGGTGLNLTGADTVIHFDPWWNPAVEDQATDRAHRIGQTRMVNSYKLITRDSIEEKILKLQQKKRDLIRQTFADESGMTGQLNWEEIQELLEP